MRKPINPNIAPIGGWRFEDPDTGFAFTRKYNTLDDLIQEVVKYRTNNRLPVIGNLKELIYNYVCEQDGMQTYCCEVRTKSRSYSQYARGAYAYVKAQSMGEQAFVSEELAEARANVCLNCPLMKIPQQTSEVERKTNAQMEKLVGSRTVPQHKELFTCDVCSCLVRAKVHFSRSIVDQSLSDRERAALPKNAFGKDGEKFTCWQIVEPKIDPNIKYKSKRVDKVAQLRKGKNAGKDDK